MDLPPQLVPALFHKRGIGLVVGETGSGKSTLLSAMIRHIVEDPDANVAVLTFEAPIEFVYDQVVMPSAAVDQSQVPQDVPSFAEGLRGALRRHPGVILIGEARDRETISAMLTAAASGHMTYTTVHANGVVETVQRIVNEFAAEEQARVAVGLVSSLRFILCQTLVPAARAGDRRVPIREYLIMDDRVKRDLFGADGQVAGITQRARAVLAQHGHSFLQDARARHAEGRISMETLETFERIERAESGAQSVPTSSMPSFDDLLLPEVSHG
jgi:defect-in-organelle-trafficking protein DotB